MRTLLLALALASCTSVQTPAPARHPTRPSGVSDAAAARGCFALAINGRELQTCNSGTDEGRNYIRDLIFKNGTTPGNNLYFGLALSTTPITASSTLATIEELQVAGYGRMQVLASEWTATGTGSVSNVGHPATWTGLNQYNVGWVFLATSASGTSGKLLAYAPISPAVYLAASDLASATYTWSIAW